MLSTEIPVAPPREKVVKQGWFLKKGGTGLLATWKPKFILLVALQDGHSLYIYDDRDVSKNPKHEINLSEIRIDSKTMHYFLLPKGAVAFKLWTANRKFYLASNTRAQYEEWISVIIQMYPSIGHDTPIINEISRTFARLMRPKSALDDSDAKSVYSVACRDDEDDNISIYSTSSKATGFISNGEIASVVSRNESTVSSNFDTLSFRSEPVLTTNELTLMGSESEDTKATMSDINEKCMETIKLVIEPENLNEIDWHQKYIDILKIRAESEDALLSKDVQLMELIGKFKETASFHMRKIIDEYHIVQNTERGFCKIYLPNADQSYSKNGIKLRFACDYNVSTEEEIKYSIAKTSAELRGNAAIARAIFDRKLLMQTVPFYPILMCLIDYKGFRMVAHAEINKNVFKVSLQVIAIHNLNPKRLKIDETICHETSSISHYLNLKSHTVQVSDDRRVRVFLSATAEIHCDELRSQYYLTCLRDIFPLDYNFNDKCQDFNFNLNNFKRLRPEFLQIYQTPLCSDGLSPMSGGSKREIESNDEDLVKAARFLKENWIPSFVKLLDNMEVCPYDSQSLTKEMHKRGINIRYLSTIYQLSTIPFVRNLLLVEMIARACKSIFQTRFRNAILHFKKVGATSINEQMNTYAINLIQTVLGYSEKTEHLVATRLKKELMEKFSFDLSPKMYFEIHRPSLFLAIQFHCGIKAEDSIEYDFYSSQILNPTRFENFVVNTKTINGIFDSENANSRDDDKLAYIVAKHFKSIGPSSKLLKLNGSAVVMTMVAAHYNAKNRFEEAKLYAQAAVSSCSKNSAMYGLAIAQLVFATAGLQSCVIGAPDPTLLIFYRKAVVSINWHWGEHNPLGMTLHDRMSEIYHRAKDLQKAFEFHSASLERAEKSLGKTHTITAVYLARSGCYLSNLGQTEKAIEKFTQSLEIFQSSRSDNALIAEVYYHFAEVLEKRGDYDAAIDHAQKCRRIREQAFGFSDIRVINSCRQVSTLILAPYKQYTGVLTPAIKNAYREAISCNEKVFRFLQNQSSLGYRKSKRLSRRISTNVKPSKGRKYEISGPLLEAPLGWTEPFTKNLMHKLTKDIVSMKLALVESPMHRECIRGLRLKKLEIQRGKVDFESVFDAEDARNTIVKMAAVTPSVYLDDILQRIGHGDDSAVEELGMVIILTESETVGMTSE